MSTPLGLLRLMEWRPVFSPCIDIKLHVDRASNQDPDLCSTQDADNDLGPASLAVARGDDGRTYGPRLRSLLPWAGMPAASLGSPGRITIRAARKLSLQAKPLERGAGLEVPRRTPRTWWPHGGRRTPRLATAARAVARGLHVHTPRLCARGLPMCRHHLYMGKWYLQPQHLLQ